MLSVSPRRIPRWRPLPQTELALLGVLRTQVHASPTKKRLNRSRLDGWTNTVLFPMILSRSRPVQATRLKPVRGVAERAKEHLEIARGQTKALQVPRVNLAR